MCTHMGKAPIAKTLKPVFIVTCLAAVQKKFLMQYDWQQLYTLCILNSQIEQDSETIFNRQKAEN